MSERKTFYIIDGHAQIYRAYFAPFRDLSSPAGEPTKATYVFTQWLLNLVENRKPDHLAMVIDTGDESVFRKEIFPDYKANREPPPVDLLKQEKQIFQIVRDLGIPIFAKPGYEADDLIATLVHRLGDKGFETVLVSKDKDLRQLINNSTRMYDVQADIFTDLQRMQTEYGYSPAQAVDVQTLMGDAVDNVQGIPGVGEKTAAKLIVTYGSVEGVLQNVDKLTPKMKENFQKYADRLPIARKLVTLKDDVEFEFDPEKCAFNGLNVDALRPHLQSLGFTTLLKRLVEDGESVAAPIPQRVKSAASPEMGLFGSMQETSAPAQTQSTPQTCADCDYRLVQTPEEFQSFLTELKKQKRFAFDTETDALGAMASSLVGLSFSWQPKTGWYVAVCGPQGSTFLDCDETLAQLKPILENPAVKKVGHNLKYDMLVVRKKGIEVRGVSLDTMIAAFVLDSSRMQYGIDRLALDLLNIRKVPTSDLIGKGSKQISMQKVDLPRIAAYASEDADVALRLADLLESRLAELPTLKKLCDEVETPLIDVLVEMEWNGIAIDPGILKEQSQVLGVRIEELRKKIFESACFEFNPDSPKQLQEVLFNRLKLPIIKRTKTGASTDVEVLEKLADKHECPRLILDYRSLVKLKNTYLDNLTDFVNPRTGRIHASFNQTGAGTGRLSCSDPNLQNIPIRTDEGRRIRLAFVPGDPKKNVLLTADYSQIELRVLAHFTREPALLRAFEADEDIHRAVAAEVFGVPLEKVTREQRAQAKIINFGIVYGVSAHGLARRIEGMTVPAAQQLINDYARRFPSIQKFLDQCVMEAQSNGFVETILGRRRPIMEISSSVLAIRKGGERMAINSVVQGSAADLIKVAMNNIHRRIKRENRPSRPLLQVHDELVFETPLDVVEAEAAMVREEMTGAMKLAAPLKVEVGWGKNWQEVK
ncbi:MAG TPA: DNA polymerase I [Tepidisphaeraceae bacterium]|jgi:DNA polymerase-1|nr:DNA polymerase I [Tepidisphaeraceae bacterium]